MASLTLSCSGGGSLPPRDVAAPDPCAELPLLRAYERNGALRRTARDVVELDLPVDLHAADCGAPDGYGHEKTLTLSLASANGRCEIRSAVASAEAYGIPDDVEAERSWKNSFAPADSPNLALANLRQIELRDAARREAVLLLPRGYFFYQNVTERDALKPALEPEDATDCCYGYTSSRVSTWSDAKPE